MGGLSRIRLDGLANNSVANTNIVDGAIGAAEIATGAVKATEVAAGGIAANTAFASGIITQHAIASGNIVTSTINDGAVTTAKIGALSVTNAKIASGNVVTSKLNDGAVTGAKLATGAVSANTKIASGVITQHAIASGNIVTSTINDGAVTAAKVGADAINQDKIADDSIRPEHINAGAINSNTFFAAASVDRNAIGAAAVGISELNVGLVSSGNGVFTHNAHTFVKAQRGTIDAVSVGAANVTMDFANTNHFALTLGTNSNLNRPSNLTAGQTGSIFVIQDGTGSRTLSYSSVFDFAGGTAPTLTTTASAVDRIDYVVRSSSSIHAVATLALS